MIQRARPTENSRTSRIEFRHNGVVYQATIHSQTDGWGLIFKVDVDGHRSRWMYMDSNGYYQFRFKKDWVYWFDMKPI